MENLGRHKKKFRNHLYGFLQAFFISKETPTAERRQEKETL